MMCDDPTITELKVALECQFGEKSAPTLATQTVTGAETIALALNGITLKL